MVANPTPKPLTPKERQIIGLRNKIALIRATMPPLRNRREQRQINKIERMIRELQS